MKKKINRYKDSGKLRLTRIYKRLIRNNFEGNTVKISI